jgi:hypothetical protein
MASLGDLLEVIHDAATDARPAQVSVTEWRHNERAGRAWQAFLRARHPAADPRAGEQGPDTPAESTSTVRLFYDGPDRYREESAGRQEGARHIVRDGDRWVTWDEDWGLVSSDSEPEDAPPASSVGFMLDPIELTAAFRFGPPTETTAAGRPALTVRATARDGIASAVVFSVGPGADEVELAFDAETGALLRSEARLGGEPFHRLEVTEIAYGPAPPNAFVVEPSAGHDGASGRQG